MTESDTLLHFSSKLALALSRSNVTSCIISLLLFKKGPFGLGGGDGSHFRPSEILMTDFLCPRNVPKQPVDY